VQTIDNRQYTVHIKDTYKDRINRSREPRLKKILDFDLFSLETSSENLTAVSNSLDADKWYLHKSVINHCKTKLPPAMKENSTNKFFTNYVAHCFIRNFAATREDANIQDEFFSRIVNILVGTVSSSRIKLLRGGKGLSLGSKFRPIYVEINLLLFDDQTNIWNEQPPDEALVVKTQNVVEAVLTNNGFVKVGSYFVETKSGLKCEIQVKGRDQYDVLTYKYWSCLFPVRYFNCVPHHALNLILFWNNGEFPEDVLRNLIVFYFGACPLQIFPSMDAAHKKFIRRVQSSNNIGLKNQIVKEGLWDFSFSLNDYRNDLKEPLQIPASVATIVSLVHAFFHEICVAEELGLFSTSVFCMYYNQMVRREDFFNDSNENVLLPPPFRGLRKSAILKGLKMDEEVPLVLQHPFVFDLNTAKDVTKPMWQSFMSRVKNGRDILCQILDGQTSLCDFISAWSH